MRTSTLFAATTRSGVRQGRRNVVVYLRATAQEQPVRAGFVVSKAVGNAVTRNKVKRRLRALVNHTLKRAEPTGYDVVVRALPPAGQATFEQLATDWSSAWSKAHTKVFVPVAHASGGGHG